MVIKRIQDIDTIVMEGQNKAAVIVLHGYGANFQDLVPIKDYIPGNENYDWYFPDGPIELPMGAFMVGKAWFPITMSEFEKAIISGQAETFFKDQVPNGLQKITEKMRSYVEELRTKYDKIYLGGFSQGSMVALNLSLQIPNLVDKLFLLSSTLVSENNWKEWSADFNKPIFQSHGKIDQVLPFAGALNLKEILESKRDYEFHEFHGGHEIPPQILKALGGFLSK